MNAASIRKRTRAAKKVQVDLQRLLVKHVYEKRVEKARQIKNTIRRAVELASAKGENEVIVSPLWCQDTDALEDVVRNDVFGLELTWGVDQEYANRRSMSDRAPVAYYVKLNW